MKSAIVTGAGGFIGGALTRKLLACGVEVYGVDITEKLLEQYAENPNFTPIVANFSQYENIYALIPHGKAEVFYHFAWQGVFGDAFKNYYLQLDNAKYACEAVNQAIKLGCKRFVFAGSMNEYEMNNYIGKDYFEPRYTYIYSVTKQVSEAIGKTLAYYNSIEYCSGRIAMAYGEQNRSMMIPNVIIKNLLTNMPCKLVEGKGLYDMIYIDDIAEAFKTIGEKGVHMKSYYVGHRKLKTFREIMEEIANILNPKCQLLFGEYPDVPSGVDYSKIDLEALYNDTGFECKADFRESILKTARWLKESGI